MQVSNNTKQTRRVQLSGGSTYIVSLPKSWIEELKIEAGDNVTIVKNSNKSLTLFLNDQNEDEDKSMAVIMISQNDSVGAIKRKIISTYLSGFNLIQIKSRGMKIPADHFRGIRSLVRSSMIGTEIVESSSDIITIQVLTRLPELSFDTALSRMFLMSQNMIKESIESFEENDPSHAEEVVNMDDEVDRFGLYMRRNLVIAVGNENVLQEMGLRNPAECLGYRVVITRIERIADHASLIAKRIKFIDGDIDPKIVDKIKRLTEKTLHVYEEAVVAVQRRDFAKAESVAEKSSSLISEEKQIMTTVKDNERNSTIIRFVLEDLRRIVEYSSDIAEVAIDENIENIIAVK